MQFPHLFQPIDVGNMTVKNRIFFPGHATRLVDEGGVVGERLIAYHKARAEADVGLIITEVNCVHETYLPPNRLSVATDECIPGLKRLADMGRPYDCRVIGQMFHPGRVSGFSADGSIMATYAPSEVPDEFYKNVPMPLSTEQVWEIIHAFASGARRMVEAGLDGVELLSSMGYIISQFLNPRLNQREDEFGGSAENRMRFLREIVRSCRREAGDEFVLGMRISADEMDDEGLKPGETLAAIQQMDAEGQIDYFNIISGTAASITGWAHLVPHMVMPNSLVVPLAADVKKVVTKPVFVAGRVNQPQDAEQIIATGDADMVGVVRGHIADPEFTKKAREGRAEDIRACIACNQACIGHGLKGFAVSCIQHPETGREPAFYSKRKTDNPKKVMVVGGGPGGMKAAIAARQYGHDVTLYEKDSRLGGQALLAQLLPDRAEFGGIVTNLSRELEIHEVRVKTNVEVTADLVAAEEPGAIILATGAFQVFPDIEGLDDAHVVNSWPVIRGESSVGQSVVVWDWRSDWVGLGLAQMLAQDGCRVRLAVNAVTAGQCIPHMVRDYAVGELHKLGVEIVPYVRLFGIDSGSVYFQHVTSGEPVVLEDVDTLVTHHAPRRNVALLATLSAFEDRISLVGDCLNPRTAEEAVLEGLKAAQAIA